MPTGVYDWVRDAIHPALGNGKIPAVPTWTLYLLEDGGYMADLAAHEAFSVVPGGAIVDSMPVTPGAFAAGTALLPNVTFPLLTGPDVGAVVLTVSGSIERLYAHWDDANAGLPFTPNGSHKTLTNLKLVHRTVTS